MGNVDDPTWKNLVKDKKYDIRIDSKYSDGGFLTMRASGNIDYSPIDVWRCIQYNPWRT